MQTIGILVRMYFSPFMLVDSSQKSIMSKRQHQSETFHVFILLSYFGCMHALLYAIITIYVGGEETKNCTATTATTATSATSAKFRNGHN